MIITLTGANFSENNIGTLNSWRIVRALQGVYTQSTITAVKKGSSYTATFTVNDGYQYASSSVTMKGSPIDNMLVWNEGKTQATLTIPQVEGNVYISIIANAGSGKKQLTQPYIYLE